jgi:hypothetical protein
VQALPFLDSISISGEATRSGAIWSARFRVLGSDMIAERSRVP